MVRITSIPGRIVPGVLADKMGNFNVMFVTMLCSGLVTLTLWLPSSSNAAIIAFTIIYGVFSGAYIALAPILIAQISKIQQIGVRSGALFLGVSIAALTGGPLAGALLDTDHGGFEYIQIFAGSMMCAAAGLLLISRAFTLGFTIAKA